jgi:hypothetical protein
VTCDFRNNGEVILVTGQEPECSIVDNSSVITLKVITTATVDYSYVSVDVEEVTFADTYMFQVSMVPSLLSVC